MPTLTHYQDSINVLPSGGTYLVPGASYTATVFSSGAVASATSSGQTITVDVGHGFSNGQKLMVGTDVTTYRTIDQAPGATSIHVSASVTIPSTGSLITNLGADTGGVTPSFDVSAATIYSDQDGGVTISQSRVTADSNGNFGFWHNLSGGWLMIRDTTGTVVKVIPDTVNYLVSFTGPTASVDNAIVRFDGTGGKTVQDYTSGAPTIGDTGAVVLASTLSVAGAATLTTSVAVGASGTAVTQIRIYSTSFVSAAVTGGTTSEQNYTVTGVTTADKVFVNKPTHQAGLGIVNARVSASNTVSLSWMNVTAGSLTPTTENYLIVAIRS